MIQNRFKYAAVLPACVFILFAMLIIAACTNGGSPSEQGSAAMAEPETTAAVQPSEEPAQTKTEEPTAKPPEPHSDEPEPTFSSYWERKKGPILNEWVSFQSDGLEVNALICVPESSDGPCPCVVLCHGFDGDMDAGGGFRYISEALCRHGVASIRLDYAGCGERKAQSGFYCLSEMRRDTVNAVEYLINRYEVDPQRIGMIGYSLGGRVVLETLAAGELDPFAILLIAPAASTKDFIRLCGGRRDWDACRKKANRAGETRLFGVTLGPEFFREMELRESPAIKARRNFHGSSAVVFAKDDSAVLPEVSARVAEIFKSEQLVFERCGHAYGLTGEPGNSYLSDVIKLALRLFASPNGAEKQE